MFISHFKKIRTKETIVLSRKKKELMISIDWIMKNKKSAINNEYFWNNFSFHYPKWSTCIQVSWPIAVDDVKLEWEDSSSQKEDEAHQRVNQILHAHTHTHTKQLKLNDLINRTWAKMFVVIRCIPILVEFQIQRGEPRRWELLRVAYRQWSWRRRGNDRDRRPGWARRRRTSCNSAARRCKWWPATIQLTSGTAGGIDE